MSRVKGGKAVSHSGGSTEEEGNKRDLGLLAGCLLCVIIIGYDDEEQKRSRFTSRLPVMCLCIIL